MAITLVATEHANASTLTMPTHQAGDLIVSWAMKVASSNITFPSGYTNLIATSFAGGISHVAGFKYAASSSESFETWTTATSCGVFILRGDGDLVVCDAASGVAASTLTLQWGTSLFRYESLALAWAMIRNLTTNIETAPSGFTNQEAFNDGTNEYAMHVSDDVIGPGAFASNQTLTGTAATARWAWAEVYECPASGGGFYNPFSSPVFGAS